MKIRFWKFVLAAVFVGSHMYAASAQEENSNCIRISLGAAPGVTETDWGGVKFDADADTGGQLEVLYVKRFWDRNNPSIGGFVGGGIFFAGHSGKDDHVFYDNNYDIAAFGFMGQGGLVVKVGESVVLEAGSYLGLGGAGVSVSGYSDEAGSYAMYGLKGGAFLLLGDTVELGVELGVGGFSSSIDVEYSGGGIETIDIRGSGARISAVLGFSF